MTHWKYPASEPYDQGLLTVSEKPLHRIHWRCFGNPKGEPVLFIHGGPGGGAPADYARFFDPARYRIVLYDQRGCGLSEPHAAKDQRGALADNTTQHLIADIEKLRDHLNMTGRCHVFGGSWGSTLSLAYAVTHPEHVKTLILRGIFLCRREDIDYFYQGNAALYESNPLDTSLPGTYLTFPEAWKPYVEVIAPQQRGDMIKAYFEIFMNPKTDPLLLERAAIAWSVWEGSTSYLVSNPLRIKEFSDPAFAKAFGPIENHYFMNGGFLGGSGEGNRDNNYLLENVGGLARHSIAWHIVHGQYDQVCPRLQADALIAALGKAGIKANYVLTAAGHAQTEPPTRAALTAIMDDLTPL